MFEYNVVYSKRRSIAAIVNRDLSVTVRAPFFVSKKQIEKFVNDYGERIEKAIEKTREKNKKIPPEISEEKLKELTLRAKEYIPDRVKIYSELTGLVPISVKITHAKTRFGSCSGKNSICFSCFLMNYPNDAVDYVVMHELAHIKHKNHGKDFYKLIEKYMPDYKQREKLLKSNIKANKT